MINSQKSEDVILSQKRWEVIHKSQKIRNLSNDPTISSYKAFLNIYKNDLKKGIFLDLGCGIAYVSSLLAKEGVEVLGIDVSKEAIFKSKDLFKRNKLPGKFIEADLLNLPLKSNSVNFIYSCMSLEYVKDTQKAVDEAYRVLRKNGKIVIIVPIISLTTLTYHQLRGDIPNLPYIKNFMEWFHIKVLKGRYMKYGYEQSFTRKGLERIFKNSGFKINKVGYFDMHYPIAFIPSFIRPFIKKILRYRIFWPLVYIEAVK